MRRSRNVREYRDGLIRRRPKPAPKKKEQENKKEQQSISNPLLDKRRRRLATREEAKRLLLNTGARPTPPAKPVYSPASSPAPTRVLDFQDFDSYRYSSRPLKVLHLIDSLGLGGAQTMMLELVNGLNRYYGDHITNDVGGIHRKNGSNTPLHALYSSYNVSPFHISKLALKEYCLNHQIDVVLHHRTVNAICIRKHLPPNTGYMLLNHTWNNMRGISDFAQCDFYISVCKFLHTRTRWHTIVHPSRKKIILNGVENNYIDDLEYKPLEKGFISGRCHRMVGGKFRVSSLHWMINTVAKQIPKFHHYMIGASKQAQKVCSQSKFLHHLGSIPDRNKKMSIIKQFDVYFYETFQHEGASVAVLEALACGVPVICYNKGGNTELVENRINGFIAKNQMSFLQHMTSLATKPKVLKKMKQQTRIDFDNRLHVRHTACKYMQLFESLVKK